MTRVLLIALGLVALLALGCFLYGRSQAKSARQSAMDLALERQAHQGVLDQLTQQTKAVEALQAAGHAQEARVRTAEASATTARREGSVRAHRVLATQAPGEPQTLIRWAAAEAQDLSTRLEAP